MENNDRLFKTGINVPSLFVAWRIADAKTFAENHAASHLSQNRSALKEQGIKKPAAALYIHNGEYNFAVYDDKSQRPKDVIPDGLRIIKEINPYYLD